MKRVIESGIDSESSDEDELGPKPLGQDGSEGNHGTTSRTHGKHISKKPRTLKFEQVYLDNLPNAELYEKSFMHRDEVTHIAVAKSTEYVITASADGHVKFWKKMASSIEFVKHYHAHLGAISGFDVSADGKMLVTTCSQDRMIKFFDVQSFDMSNMIAAKHVPTVVSWLNGRTGLFTRVAVADANSGLIRIYRSEGEQEAIADIGIHSSPVKCLTLNIVMSTMISIDTKGVIEYWDVDAFTLPEDRVSFTYKTDTDLYDLAKSRTSPCSIASSQQGLIFATTSVDKKIRIFDFKTGKLRRKYDEAATVYSGGGSTVSALGIDSLDLGRRVAVEKELESLPDILCRSNAVFDESGNFLIYGSLVGIKILNLVSNRVVRTLGTAESGERFLALCLYQGIPKVDAQYMLSKSGGGNGRDSASVKTADQLHTNPVPDPTIFCTSFKRRRFYLFSTRNPDETLEPRYV